MNRRERRAREAKEREDRERREREGKQDRDEKHDGKAQAEELHRREPEPAGAAGGAERPAAGAPERPAVTLEDIFGQLTALSRRVDQLPDKEYSKVRLFACSYLIAVLRRIFISSIQAIRALGLFDSAPLLCPVRLFVFCFVHLVFAEAKGYMKRSYPACTLPFRGPHVTPADAKERWTPIKAEFEHICNVTSCLLLSHSHAEQDLDVPPSDRASVKHGLARWYVSVMLVL